MNPAARLIFGCALAVAVPAAALHDTAPPERLAAGLSAAPFAWPRVLVAHLVAALPLGFIVAGWVRSIGSVNDAGRGVWLAVGAGVAWLGTHISPVLGEMVVGFGEVPLLVLRAAFAFALVLPWCVWAAESPAVGKPGVLFGLGFALALIPCGLYAEGVVRARTEQAADLLRRELIVRADAVLAGLVELGSERPIVKQPPAEIRKGIAKSLVYLRLAADRPLPANARPAARLDLALTMIRLDRLGDAIALLRPLVPGDDTATLLLATVYRDQEQWKASDELFTGVLEKRLPRAATDPAARDACLTALNGLAFNARADRRPADAERVLARGLEVFPERAADFHFEFGRHYQDAGRPALAVEHLQTAARLDPAKYRDRVEATIRDIRTATPACLLPR